MRGTGCKGQKKQAAEFAACFFVTGFYTLHPVPRTRLCATVDASCFALSLIIAAILLCATQAHAAQPFQTKVQPKETSMSHHVEGPFDVKTTPMSTDEITTGTAIGRFSLDKQYHGALDAKATGEMLPLAPPLPARQAM